MSKSRHAPTVKPPVADSTFDDVMRMSEDDIQKLFKGIEPFVRLPVHMWEDLMYFINEMLDNLSPIEEYFNEFIYRASTNSSYQRKSNLDPDAEMSWSEYERNKSGLIETLNRIRNQVPGAANGIKPPTDNAPHAAHDNAQRAINGV